MLLVMLLTLPLAACGETGTSRPGATPTPPPEAAEPGASESDVTLCEALGDAASPRPSVAVAVTPAGSDGCDEIASCLAEAAAAAHDDPTSAAVRFDDCLGAIPDTSAVSAMVGMPGVGALGVVTGTSVWSLSVACQSPAVDARLAEGDAAGLDAAFALYAEASSADDPAVRDEKIKAANAVITGFEQSVLADTTDLGGDTDGGGPTMDGDEFEWSDDTTWAEDAASAAAEVGDLIDRAGPDGATRANDDANAAIFSTIGSMYRAFAEGGQRTAETDDPCAEMALRFAECNAKEWRTDQCQQLRNSFINPQCDATTALTAEGTPCATADTPDAQAMLTAAIEECHKLVRGTDGTDPCQPPAFEAWQGGATPSLCSDPAALTGDDQCLPGWFPPEDLDRIAHARQIAVLAEITRKYGGQSIVVVPPSGPTPGFDPGPK